jgi:P63C domain
MQANIFGGFEMSETEISKAAKTLSKLGASKGGLARAEKMTSEQRSEVASRAATVRWNIPRAEHIGEIHIGDMRFPCSVLSDGTRILTQTDFMEGMGMYYSGWVARSKAKNESSADTPHFLAFKSLEPFISQHLGDLQSVTVKYRTKERNRLVHGIKAEIIPKICEVWLDADKHGKLGSRQKQIAQKADIIIRTLAHVGIIALIDEATGYQEVRDRHALQEILDKYLRKEFAAWAKCFPEEFYKQIFRLRQWQWRGMKVNRPQIVAHYTKDLVYARLAPGILTELEARNPKNEKGHRRAPHYWWLTEDVGHPALAQLLFGVIGLMRIAENWDEFMRMVDKAYPRRGDTLQLELFQNDEFYIPTQPIIAVAK